MRQPSFQGMREDKDAKDVVREKALPAKKVVAEADADAEKVVADKVLAPVKAKDRSNSPQPRRRNANPQDQRSRSPFTHLSKKFWPKEKYTKRDLLNYYYQVAPYILPWLKDDPNPSTAFPTGSPNPVSIKRTSAGRFPTGSPPSPITAHRIKKIKSPRLHRRSQPSLYGLAGLYRTKPLEQPRSETR